MTRRFVGIDEAGYGPILGPLVIVRAGAVGDDLASLRNHPTGAVDSKQLHTPGNLGPLEAVALPALWWLSGQACATAAEVFAVFGETDADRANCPWMAGAEDLALPITARNLEPWRIPGLRPDPPSGAIIHPGELNRAAEAGTNRAQVVLAVIQRALTGLAGTGSIMIDRLGGRKFYAPALRAVVPDGCSLEIDEETAATSRYRIAGPATDTSITFQCKADTTDVLCAVASCVAKYTRELHMLLLNRYWSGQCRHLKATAGYGSDAHRWLYQLGAGFVEAWRHELVRGRTVRDDPEASS